MPTRDHSELFFAKESASGWNLCFISKHNLTGGRYLKPPKFEHICSCHNFFLLSSVQILFIRLVAYCVCFKMICKKFL